MSANLALLSLGFVSASWLDYLIKIPRENVPVRPVWHSLLMAAGIMGTFAALLLPFFSSAVPVWWVVLASLTTLSMAGLFFYLLTLARLPDTPPTVHVGDPFIPFEAVTHEGLPFNTTRWHGRRVMFKLYRGHW